MCPGVVSTIASFRGAWYLLDLYFIPESEETSQVMMMMLMMRTMMRMMMRMMVMTFFDWTTTNLCDAAQIAERAAASGHLRNHESLWEKLVNCNSF